MNVKISLTIPVEEVPNKVAQTLNEKVCVVDELKKHLLKICEDAQNKHDLLNAVSAIDDLRKKIFLVDCTLEDCYNILKGYINMQSSNKSQESSNVTDDYGKLEDLVMEAERLKNATDSV